MLLPRKYTVTKIQEFVDAIRGSADVSQKMITGMDTLVEILNKFSTMTDADLEAYARNAYRVLRKEEQLQNTGKIDESRTRAF